VDAPTRLGQTRGEQAARELVGVLVRLDNDGGPYLHVGVLHSVQGGVLGPAADARVLNCHSRQGLRRGRVFNLHASVQHQLQIHQDGGRAKLGGNDAVGEPQRLDVTAGRPDPGDDAELGVHHFAFGVGRAPPAK